MKENAKDTTFNHLLLTRFNVKVAYGSLDEKGNHIGITESYLDYRFSLFERFCLPSILNQTAKNFQWLIFFDMDTPEKYKNKIKTYSKNSCFTPFYVSHFDEVNSVINDFLRKENIDVQWIITTRLDCDDMLHKDTMKAVQQNFGEKQEVSFCNIDEGVYYDMNNKIAYEGVYLNNMFSSRYEIWAKKNIDTVLGTDHRYIDELGKVHSIRNLKGWTILIHGSNVANVIPSHGIFPILNKNIALDYGVSVSDFYISRGKSYLLAFYIAFRTVGRLLGKITGISNK